MTEDFSLLLKTINSLLGPNGCPWDLKQTVESMRSSLEEECHEVSEAIKSNDNGAIEEELGDLLFNLLFIARLAEKEGRFTLQRVIDLVNEKFIRRHPHVFDTPKKLTEEELHEQWKRIKEEEKRGKN